MPTVTKGNVFVVDENKENRALLIDGLSTGGYETQAFLSASDALKAVRRKPPEVLVSDLAVAQANGGELVKTLREEFPGVALIVEVEVEAVDAAIEAMEMGAFEYVVKPVRNRELLLAVERARECGEWKSLNEMMKDYPTLAQLEKRYIALVLERTEGRKDKAAQMLGINRRTLYRKEREYGWASPPGSTERSRAGEQPNPE